jgi:hypothetical protein
VKTPPPVLNPLQSYDSRQARPWNRAFVIVATALFDLRVLHESPHNEPLIVDYRATPFFISVEGGREVSWKMGPIREAPHRLVIQGNSKQVSLDFRP